LLDKENRRMKEPQLSRRSGLSNRLIERLAAYVMVFPAMLLLGVFVGIPIIASLVLVFMRYDALTPPVWIGNDNFVRLIKDPRLLTMYSNTVKLTIGAVIGNNVLGLLIALGLRRITHRFWKSFLRTSIFFPVLTTTSTLAVVWWFLLSDNRGILNWFLSKIGLVPVHWLTSSNTVIYSLILYDIWKTCGLVAIIYLAGLQGISKEYYEAAEIDGAKSSQLFRYITLPLLTPSIFFNITLGIIGGFQIFDAPFVLTGGGPGDASGTIAFYVWQIAFSRFEFGYGSAVAVVLMIILIVITLLQFRISQKWVFYE